MLPFIFKTVETPVQRLHLPCNENHAIDVEVKNEFYTSDYKVPPNTWLRTRAIWLRNFVMWEKAEQTAYKTFTAFLHQMSEPAPFLPVERLERYPYRRYALLLSVAYLYELTQGALDVHRIRTSRFVLEYAGYELTIDANRHVSEDSAYLVSPTKFALFVRRVNAGDMTTARFYRSEFINVNDNVLPPLRLDAQEVVAAVQQDIATQESAIPISQLLLLPPSLKTETTMELTECPMCNGDVRSIGENYFCLQCDWDNLPPLSF